MFFLNGLNRLGILKKVKFEQLGKGSNADFAVKDDTLIIVKNINIYSKNKRNDRYFME